MAKNTYTSMEIKLVAANVLLLFITPITVLLRLLSRKVAAAGIGADDYMICGALAPTLTLPIITFVAVRRGFGKHVDVAGPRAVDDWYFILFLFENFYGPAIAMVKFSILLYYKRIFTENTTKMPAIVWFQRALYFVGAVTVMWLIVFQSLFIFACRPIHFFWDHQPATGYCPVNVEKVFYIQAIPNIATDLILLALPIPLIWKLQLPNAQKVSLIGIFLLGGFVVFASAVRLGTVIALPGEEDITWNYAQAAIWTSVESCVAVISACLPTLRPILKRTTSMFRSRRKVSSRTAALSGRGGGSSQQLWNRSWEGPRPERAAKGDRSFLRMSNNPEDPDHDEAWEMGESGDSFRMTQIARSNTNDRWLQEELGAIPLNAIRVTEEIVMDYHDNPTTV